MIKNANKILIEQKKDIEVTYLNVTVSLEIIYVDSSMMPLQMLTYED